MAGSIYAGLPAQFASPDDAAEQIARLAAPEARLALLERVPAGGWRRWVLHEAKIEIAYAIAHLPDLEDRRLALAAVPYEWVEDVRAHVLRLWRTREIRAQYQAELARARKEKLKEAA